MSSGSVRQGDAAGRDQRRGAEGTHPCRLCLVADHPRQVQIEPADRREGSRRQAGRARRTKRRSSTTACGRSCSWCRAASAPAVYEARKREAENLRGALPELRRRAASRHGAAGRGGARNHLAPVGRPRAAAARHAQQHAGRPADAAGGDLAGRRNVRGLPEESGGRRRYPAASAKCARPCIRSAIRRSPRST